MTTASPRDFELKCPVGVGGVLGMTTRCLRFLWPAGVALLMTPACNLPEGAAAGAALEMAANPDVIAAALKQLFDMPDQVRSAMGECGRRLVADRFAWPHVAEQMLAVYRWVLEEGPIPTCVVLD